MSTIIPLRADNFTPPMRTPWGGRKIASIKRGAVAPDHPAFQAPLGESWEVSLSSEYPSVCRETGRLLQEVLEESTGERLGPAGWSSAAVLVKYINADEPLSVQVHPADDSPDLSADECGKPEAWLVLECSSGAGLYLGFRPDVRETHVRQALSREEPDLQKLLNFVPVEPGDFFLLPPGVPHAIGAGVTLIEPQRVFPKRRGVTYRFWDWNRRYSKSGERDPNGDPRELHVEASLRTTRWDSNNDGMLTKRSFTHTCIADRKAKSVSLEQLAGPQGVLYSRHLMVGSLAGSGTYALPPAEHPRGFCVTAGKATLRDGHQAYPLRAGESALLCANAAHPMVELDQAHILVCAAGIFA